MFDENPLSMGLQILIVILASIIILLLYFERSNTSSISQKLNDFKCPTCPTCPNCPPCKEEGCPDCVCPESAGCPNCPKCPDVNTSCPSQIKVDDIVDAIFPGRNTGLTTHGQYFPLTGLGEASVEPAYSPVITLMPNYVGGDGVPAAISFEDQKLLNDTSSIGLAAQKEPPLMSTQGVFSQRKPSKVVSSGTQPTIPVADTLITNTINTTTPSPLADDTGGIASRLSNLL